MSVPAPRRSIAQPSARWVGALVLSGALVVQAQQAAFFDPPAPENRAVVRTTRTATPPVIDGDVSDQVWAQAPEITGFVQREPTQGAPASHRSSLRVLFDDTHLYFAAEFDQPSGRFNQRDLRRDFETHECDHFSILLDPLGDGRNAFTFSVNPYGAQRDAQIIDDSYGEANWDTIWKAATTRSDHGWSVELAIPFKSLRYGPPGTRWGLQAFRRERGENEDTVLTPTPRSVSPARMQYAAVLEGLETPSPSLALQLRPYAIGRLTKSGADPVSLAPSAGGEVTWSPAPSTVIDLTINTDFAETDVDRRVVNLSRFNVFFPERRQFFLESSGLFAAGLEGFIQPFFTRRIGLQDGASVPISAGGRFVYRSEQRSAGALVVHTLQTPSSNSSLFAVGRYTHHLGEESRAGGMLVARHDFSGPAGEASTNLVPVADAFFRKGVFSTRASVMGSATIGGSTTSLGGAGTVEGGLSGPWGNLGLGAFALTPQFEAKTGFIARSNVMGLSTNAGLDLRPAWRPKWLRNYGPWVDAYAVWGSETGAFQEANVILSPWWMQLSGGDEFWVMVEKTEQRLTEAFAPVRKVSFAPGAYSYERFGFQFLSQASRIVSLSGHVAGGSYYSASRFGGQLRASVQPIPHVALAGTYSFNRFWGAGVDGPQVDTHLLLFETRLAVTPRLQLIGSYQRDTDGNASILNARLAWEFLPLSFIYVVLTDTRAAFQVENGPVPELRLVAKVTYTFRP